MRREEGKEESLINRLLSVKVYPCFFSPPFLFWRRQRAEKSLFHCQAREGAKRVFEWCCYKRGDMKCDIRQDLAIACETWWNDACPKNGDENVRSRRSTVFVFVSSVAYNTDDYVVSILVLLPKWYFRMELLMSLIYLKMSACQFRIQNNT